MPVLSNAKKEHFARLVASGKDQTSSYIAAGYSPNGAAGQASTLAKDPMVMNRIEELKAKRVDRGLPPELEEDLLQVVSSDKIDEEWLLAQMQMLFLDAKSTGMYKVARDVLIDIAGVKGIGANNQNLPKEGTHDALPPPPTFQISVLLEGLKEGGSNLDELLAEAKDITAELDAAIDEDDGNDGPGGTAESGEPSDLDDGTGVQE